MTAPPLPSSPPFEARVEDFETLSQSVRHAALDTSALDEPAFPQITMSRVVENVVRAECRNAPFHVKGRYCKLCAAVPE